MPGFFDRLREKVIVFDGASGTGLMGLGLGPDDFGGHEGLVDFLCLSRPAVVRALHDSFLSAGCDVVETNSFSANALTLAEHGLADRSREIALAAARLAREVASGHARPGRPRFVAGSIGPGSRLPSLGHTTFRELSAAFLPQAEGLVEGGVDILMIETCQDPLGAKAAVAAAREAMRKSGRRVPICVSFTVELAGTMLVGTDVAAAVAILAPLGIDMIGMNCGSGPAEMARHVAALCTVSPVPVAVLPNAGLPETEGGRAVYRLEPAEFARTLRSFVTEHRVAAVGGCCGTRPEHVRALVEAVADVVVPVSVPPPLPDGGPGPFAPRSEVAGLYSAVSLAQQPPPLLVGELCNASGSRAFREALERDDLDGMLAIAVRQASGGAHVLDLSVARPGRDEVADFARLVPRIATQVTLPLMIDSTNAEAIETALERHGGRCIVNSVSLEDGRGRFDRIATLARRFGAALVVLTIDEQGMARTRERKLEVAERTVRAAVDEIGLSPADILVDPLTFTAASGDPDLRGAPLETLEAISLIRDRLPGVTVSLGVSNVSFGLSPAARRVVTSVFLHEAVARGLGAAIVDARAILPVDRIHPAHLELARRLLFDDRSGGDPLQEMVRAFEGAQPGAGPRATDEGPPCERLARRIVEGRRAGIESDVDEAVRAGTGPMDLLTGVLLPAMRDVGDSFACGRTQLPFVLQSAETMRAAMRHLEALLPAGSSRGRGVVVLATVQGDVHDIGKNLVSTVLSTNGFRVVDLGVRVDIGAIADAVGRERADAVGMSGLLVRSTFVMRDNLIEMARRGIRVPVLVGGAALTRAFVERDLAAAYPAPVRYGADAFEGLRELEALQRGSGDER